MPRKEMFNQLELTFSPVSNYVFSLIKNDSRFRHLTQDSTLYIIGQRGELTFNSLTIEPADGNQLNCHFKIRQKGNQSFLDCVLPLYQPNIVSDIDRNIKFGFEYGLPKPNPVPKTFPQENITNLLLFYHDQTFISWVSPESFIQNYLNGVISAEVTGPIEDFLNYKVHYVGKATEQSVWKRLTGHSTLQDILSLEYPFQFGSLPTHEIAILFFKLRDSVSYHTVFSGDTITSDLVDSILGNYPNEKTISIDAEKALINAMQPKYNREFYKNYPKSKDGLYDYNIDACSYTIHSNITLDYQNGKIRGLPDIMRADSIIVEREQPLRVFNNN